jgi:hypothetical protein
MIVKRIFKLDGTEQMPLPFLCRVFKIVPGTGKVLIVQADVNSITRTVRRFNLNQAPSWGGVTLTENGTSVNVASAIFNTLQTDNAWWKDGQGYNFADTIPATSFPGLGAYSTVYTFTPAGGAFNTFELVIRHNMVSLQGVLSEG